MSEIHDQLLEAITISYEPEPHLLLEYVNYNQLVAATRDHFSTRFKTVKDVVTQPPQMVILKGGDSYLSFNSRSRPPSGSGRPHNSNITFYPDTQTKRRTAERIKEWWNNIKGKFKNLIGKKVPPKVLKGSDLRQMKCKVSCDCEDFKYRMEVALHAKGAADIKHSNGARPNVTNPDMDAGLCKHLLAALRYLTDDASIQAKSDAEMKPDKETTASSSRSEDQDQGGEGEDRDDGGEGGPQKPSNRPPTPKVPPEEKPSFVRPERPQDQGRAFKG
jgi:hypothetical protein